MVIWRLAGTVSAVGSPASRTATRMLANFGKYLASGSSIRILPRSYSIRAPTVVIGLVIDAMLKMVSVVIARPAALSRHHQLAVPGDGDDRAGNPAGVDVGPQCLADPRQPLAR